MKKTLAIFIVLVFLTGCTKMKEEEKFTLKVIHKVEKLEEKLELEDEDSGLKIIEE